MTLAIYCAGGTGKEVLALALSVAAWRSIIFVDDVTDKEWYEGAKIFRFENLSEISDDIEFVIANGEPAAREALYTKIKNAGYKMATIYGRGCTILPGAVIGEGCIFYDCIISADAVIEPNVLFNGKALIGHNTIVGAHSVVSFNCFIGGYTNIGKKVYLSPGAMVKDRVKVGNSAIISLGTVILRNVKERAIMMGNPATRIGFNTEDKVFGMFDK